MRSSKANSSLKSFLTGVHQELHSNVFWCMDEMRAGHGWLVFVFTFLLQSVRLRQLRLVIRRRRDVRILSPKRDDAYPIQHLSRPGSSMQTWNSRRLDKSAARQVWAFYFEDVACGG